MQDSLSAASKQQFFYSIQCNFALILSKSQSIFKFEKSTWLNTVIAVTVLTISASLFSSNKQIHLDRLLSLLQKAKSSSFRWWEDPAECFKHQMSNFYWSHETMYSRLQWLLKGWCSAYYSDYMLDHNTKVSLICGKTVLNVMCHRYNEVFNGLTIIRYYSQKSNQL